MANETSTSDAKPLTRDAILGYLRAEHADELFARADEVRRTACGDSVYIRGIIEFSNCCARRCLYCGLRSENQQAERYRMKPEEILSAAQAVVDSGIFTLVLQSGDDASYTREVLCGLVHELKRRFPPVAITLSVGERPLDDYAAFKDAGADRYLIKHETINRSLYARLHPGQSWDERMLILWRLREHGFQVGTGCMVGLPGQTMDDLADEIEFFASFQPDMAGIGPFLPQADTPLAAEPAGNGLLVLKMVALTRLVTRNAHLPVTTALASLDPVEGQVMGLRAGANVIMINGTPDVYRTRYRIYDHKKRVGLDEAFDAIRQAGRTASGARGDSLKPAVNRRSVS